MTTIAEFTDPCLRHTRSAVSRPSITSVSEAAPCPELCSVTMVIGRPTSAAVDGLAVRPKAYSVRVLSESSMASRFRVEYVESWWEWRTDQIVRLGDLIGSLEEMLRTVLVVCPNSLRSNFRMPMGRSSRHLYGEAGEAAPPRRRT